MLRRVFLSFALFCFCMSHAMDQTDYSEDLKLSSICLSEVLQARPEMLEITPEPGVLWPTGNYLTIRDHVFQIRSFFFEDRQSDKDLKLTFGDYLLATGQENLLPLVINQGYGTLLMYNFSPENYFCFIVIRPGPSDVYKNFGYPVIDKPVVPHSILPGNNYTVGEILEKLSAFSKSPSSWEISKEVGKIIIMNNGKRYQVSQAFFEDPRRIFTPDITVYTFAEIFNLLDKTTFGFSNNGIFSEIFYRPSFLHEDGAVLYISLREKS